MTWNLRVAKRAQKALERIPIRDQRRILAALDEIQSNPFSGDIARLKADHAGFRRRVGNYRIFFDLQPDRYLIDIVEITRRTTSTY